MKERLYNVGTTLPSMVDGIRVTTFCTRFWCKAKLSSRCCCVCPDRDICPEVCYNSPERCGLAENLK